MLYFLFYTLLIVLIYSAFHYLVNQRINEAFFTIDDLLQHEDALVHEEYARIPSKNAQNAAYIIFDEDGKTVYASNRTINEKVFYQDMELIGDYHSGHFFDVFEDLAPDGSIQYLVYLSSYWHDGPVPKALDYCVLDEDYHIL